MQRCKYYIFFIFLLCFFGFLDFWIFGFLDLMDFWISLLFSIFWLYYFSIFVFFNFLISLFLHVCISLFLYFPFGFPFSVKPSDRKTLCLVFVDMYLGYYVWRMMRGPGGLGPYKYLDQTSSSLVAHKPPRKVGSV